MQGLTCEPAMSWVSERMTVRTLSGANQVRWGSDVTLHCYFGICRLKPTNSKRPRELSCVWIPSIFCHSASSSGSVGYKSIWPEFIDHQSIIWRL